MNDPLPELKRLMLKRLQGVKGQKLGKSKFEPIKKDQKRLSVDSAQIQAAVEELLRDGYVEQVKKRGQSYRLTPAGAEFLRTLPPPPSGYDEHLLPYHKSYLLFLLLKSAEQQASLTSLCGRLSEYAKGTLGFGLRNERDQLTVNRSLIAWILDSLAATKKVERIGQSNTPSYRLLPEGEELLGASQQYPNIRFTLTGEELNELMAAARLAGKGIAEPPQPPPESPMGPTPEQVLTEFERLKRECYAEHGMVPIHELRRVVADHFGTRAARHEVFDPILKELRQHRRIRLIALGDGGIVSEQQIADSIRGENEIYFMIGSAHEPVPAG